MTEFLFSTKLDQALILGKKAGNIPALLEGIRSVPGSSIYYHTHRFLQQHHYLSPEPPNDFAYWITDVLNEKALGEQLGSVDIVQFHRIADLRNRFIEIIGTYLESKPATKECSPGQEFHFLASRTFSIPTTYLAKNLSEFRDALSRVSVSTLYYHIFDAKLRLERGENDFSQWFERSGYPELAAEMKKLDPYTYTLEGLRKRILVLLRTYDKH